MVKAMLSHINSKLNAIWRKLRNKEYRGSFVASQISNTIAAQIFSLREARGWTQAELAEMAGMKQSRISDLEDPNYENYQTRTLLKLGSAFDVGVIVRFVPFSELAQWAANLSPKDYLPTEFLKDGIAPEIEDIKVALDATLAKSENPVNIDVYDVPTRMGFRIKPDINSADGAWLFDFVRRTSGGGADRETYTGAVSG
jgi:transcriptional regulator with XRE-family HTH domain